MIEPRMYVKKCFADLVVKYGSIFGKDKTMVNKQIIIDGVDVSGCEFYNKDDKSCREVNGKYDTDICDFDKCENSNCYYKQLKRSEAQCEGMFVTHTDLEKKYKAKEQECEELKSAFVRAECQIADDEILQCDMREAIEELKAENEELKKCYKNNSALLDFEETNTTKLVNKVMKLEKTLTEIKEIAERCGKRIPLFEIDEIAEDLEQILQKISEVEDET